MPIERLDAFMGRANAAYYAARDPYADFTTAPEIAQMFGELLGAWAAVVWQGMGAPDPLLLVEAGPGRGTLMADALRGLGRALPGFGVAARLHLIESSARLRGVQAVRHPTAVWHDGLASLPEGPMVLIANEFLDALPIRQFVRRGEGFSERFVENGAFVEGGAVEVPDRAAAEGEVVEVGEAAMLWVGELARRLTRRQGAAILLDYGPAESAAGESLQALRGGRPADPLADPGEADLTAHVDFAALAAVARAAGAVVYGPVPQGVLLERLGLFVRTAQLARRLPAGEGLALMAAARRLALPERMGRLFKALAICHPGLPVPPGFA